MADRIRRITDPIELEAVHRARVGYVFSPFNRTVHVAGCLRAGTAASRDEPKIFVADEPSARTYQRTRLADHAGAQPFRRAPCCVAAIAADVIVTRGAADGPHAAEPS